MPSHATFKKPGNSPIERYLAALYDKHAPLTDGKVADYIPELSKVDPGWFGICIATRDGHVYEVGHTRQPFTIQSVSKALTYGLALQDRGEAHMLSRVSVEPSGDAFNAISLKPQSGAPFNPMINAGAIATCGQVLSDGELSRFDRIQACLSAFAGRALSVDEEVYRSESATGHRNRAIGWMLRNFDIIDEDPTEILETYFRQCAIQVTCRDLALMAATLANQGRNPLTRERAVDAEHIDNILSVMSTCGMYDYSGEWIYKVGLPAKSGVGGGIMAVLPGQLGIGIFSPLLDAQGNSARGIKVCEDLSRDLSLHLFANGAAPQPALRLSYDGSQVSSTRRRSARHQQALRTGGHRIRVIVLQGSLIFSTLEPVVRFAMKQAPYCRYLILNFRNVDNVNEVAMRLLAQLRDHLEAQGVHFVTCSADKFSRDFRQYGLDQPAPFVDDDSAIEYCENLSLTELLGPDLTAARSVALNDCVLLMGCTPEELAYIDREAVRGEAAQGDALISAGDAGDSLYFLLEGTVEVRLPSDTGKPGKRVNVFEAGMSFGEMGFLDGSPRSADVIATANVRYRIIPHTLFERLDTEYPSLKIRLLGNLARLVADNLRRANREVTTYRG